MEKLVIFDCDGVLVDSETLSLRALVECLKDHGVLKHENQFSPLAYKGAKLSVILETIERETGSKLPTDFEKKYRAHLDFLFATDLKAIAGVASALAQIPHRLCVASSGPLEKIERSLSLTRLSHHFDRNLFSSYTVQSWKPDPGIFSYAAKNMGSEPKDCIVIEDAILGIQAALKADMRALAFVPDGNDSDFASLGVATFSSMVDLPKLIEESFLS